MVHRRKDPYCYFPGNGELAYPMWYRLVNDRGETVYARLCWRHHRILRLAGEKGRVHGPTGVRWWLAINCATPAAHTGLSSAVVIPMANAVK